MNTEIVEERKKRTWQLILIVLALVGSVLVAGAILFLPNLEKVNPSITQPELQQSTSDPGDYEYVTTEGYRSPSAVSNESGSDPLESVVIADAENFATVEVYYATDRKLTQISGEPIGYGFERGKLDYGTTRISIPGDHKMGELESPSILRFEFKEDPEKHVVLLEIIRQGQAEFFSALKSQIQTSEQKSAFIFVHGYNVSFEDAARRTGQMTYDLGFDGAPVFYSWPSHDSTPKYTFDEANIQWSKANIERFLDEFTQNSGAEKIYLIAHSMGSRALTRAYASLLSRKPELKSRFSEIILAAPDIDADVFKNELAPAMIKHGVPITLYASSKDLALEASKKVHGGHPRAGDSGENMVVLSGIESIDSTNVKTSFLGHSYYADGRAIISDMFYVLNEGLRADKRAGLIKLEDEEYWRFK